MTWTSDKSGIASIGVVLMAHTPPPTIPSISRITMKALRALKAMIFSITTTTPGETSLAIADPSACAGGLPAPGISIPFIDSSGLPPAFGAAPFVSVPFVEPPPTSMPGMLNDIAPIAACRFVSESTRNCADVTTRSPISRPLMSG